MRLKLCAYVVDHRRVVCITTGKTWWVDDRLFIPRRKLRMNMMSRFFSQSFQSNRFQLTRVKAVSAKRRVLAGFAVIVSALTACSLVEDGRAYSAS